MIIAGVGFVAGAIYDAYQQTNGFTDFCDYDNLQTLARRVVGAAAVSSFIIMAVSGVGLVGMGLQDMALSMLGLGITGSVLPWYFSLEHQPWVGQTRSCSGCLHHNHLFSLSNKYQ